MFTPVQILKIYAAEWTTAPAFAIVTARGYGSLIFILGIALFSAIKATDSYGRRALLIIICFANALLVLLHGYGTITGIENAMGWSLVLLVGFMAVWGGMLLMKEKVVS